jgi:hypothetical protein
MQITQKNYQTVLVCNQKLSGLSPIISAHNPDVFQLFHQTPRPVIADLQFALHYTRKVHLINTKTDATSYFILTMS